MFEKYDIEDKLNELKIKVNENVKKLNIKIPYIQNKLRRIDDSNKYFFFGFILALYLLPILFSAGIYLGVALIPALLVFPIYLALIYFNFKIPFNLAFNNINSEIDNGKLKFNTGLLIIVFQILQILFRPELFSFKEPIKNNIIHFINRDFLIFIMPNAKDIFKIILIAIILLGFIILLFKRELANEERIKNFSIYFLPIWIILNFLIVNLLDFIKTIIVGKITGVI